MNKCYYNTEFDIKFVHKIHEYKQFMVNKLQPLISKIDYLKYGVDDCYKNELYKTVNFCFCRRYLMLINCLENIYRLRKPSEITLPNQHTVTKLTINMQCFIFNLYGAYENLAKIYAIITKFEAERKTEISFFHNKKRLVKTLPEEIKTKFNKKTSEGGYYEYFNDYLKNVRHALAHNEPFYIPCEYYDEITRSTYLGLKQEWYKCYLNMLQPQDTLSATLCHIKKCSIELEQIDKKQKKLAFFCPVFGNNEKLYAFYSQILNDLETLTEISGLIFSSITNGEQK